MDLIKLIIDSEGLSSTCFLCLKLFVNGTNIYDTICIEDSSVDFAVKTSLWNVIKYLLPSEIILTSKACRDCAEDLKKIYLKLQVRSINILNLDHIINVIDNNISANVSGDCSIQINMPVPQEQINNDASNYEGNISELLDGQDFNASTSIKNKFKPNHNNTSKSEVCHICGKNCKSSKALQSHLNCHSQKECPHCLKILKTHSHYKKHIRSHETQVKKQRKRNYYCCDSCSYKTLNKTDLQSHINKDHLRVRPYQCEICFKSFCKKSYLTAHVLSHNKKKLICDICGSIFSVKKTLVEHLMLHEGVRNHECKHCKRKFVTLSRKNEHVRRNHSNIHYQCQMCGKKYALKKDLNRHTKKTCFTVSLADE